MEDEHTEYDQIELTYSTSDNPKISSICCPYFKIEGLSPEKLIEIIQLENSERRSMKEISEFLYPETGEPVRVRLNSKSDWTISSGKQRTYCEYDYIFEYPGMVDSIEFAAENQLEVERKIPWERAKTIDLRKAFY